MAVRFRGFVVCLLGAAVVLLVQPAWGRVLLKPKGRNATPLRTKALAAEVTVDRQFATTELELVFANESSRRLEADFIYTVPDGAVATYFAYWYGDEKVVARIVEKERAAAIYQAITSRMRDPALVELIGKNTYRARIFPIMPNSDLRVQLRMVQALPSDAEGVPYELPLREEGVAPDTYESFDVNVRVNADESIVRVINNYGLPVTKDAAGSLVTLSGKNYRPEKDLRVRQVRVEQRLHAALYAAPSGGRDGFFALALTPNHSLTRPKVTIKGIATYHVVPAGLPNVKAHESLLVCGRYRRSGAATVTLTGRSPLGALRYSQRVTFGSEAEPNSLATKLWAAGRIEQLSANRRNREAVIELSKRFTLPSTFTSWLAVPTEEMERYRREKDRADVRVLGSQIAHLIGHGRGNSAEAGRLRARFDAACRRIGWEPEPTLRTQLGSAMRQVAMQLVEEKHGARPNRTRIAHFRRQLDRLARASGRSIERYLERAERAWATEQIRSEWQRVSEEYEAAEARGDTAKAAALKRERDALRRELRMRVGGDPLIAVEAPADAQQVIAILPGGEIKRLVYAPDRRRWEARFDTPTYVTDGEYVITIIIILKDGTRKVQTMRYRVDLTPPTGEGEARLVGALEPTLRLAVDASDDTARVAAVLPWGERVELTRSTDGARFFGNVIVPPSHRGDAIAVTVVLTDKAHNRTALTLDVSQE
jgi:hypothetical protein